MRRIFLLIASSAGLATQPNVRSNVERRALGQMIASATMIPIQAWAAGITVEDVSIGGGDAVPSADATVSIAYKAWLDGFEGTKKFSDVKGPLYVTLGSSQIIPGLDEALRGMRVGGLRRVVIPPDLAYGKTGYPKDGDKKGSIIPPDATLYFEVRLRSVKLTKGLGFGLNLF